MNAVDQSNQQSMTIRIVLDGAPLAGKTTAAYTLSSALGEDAFTPADDESGRTLWFDWMSYTAGRHEGRPIRVELVTVPGHIHDRRRHLLSWADVVVFVVDTSAGNFAGSVAHYERLRNDMADVGEMPVVVIANKRDLADVVSIEQVRAELALTDDMSVIEGVATSGGGIRQAFIFAVRAALANISDPRFDETTASDLLAGMEAALGSEPRFEDGYAANVAVAGEHAGTGDVSTPSDDSTASSGALVPDAVPDPAYLVMRNVRLVAAAIADDEPVVMNGAQWRMLVRVAEGFTEVRGSDDRAAAQVMGQLHQLGLITADVESAVADADEAVESVVADTASTEAPQPDIDTADSDIADSDTAGSASVADVAMGTAHDDAVAVAHDEAVADIAAVSDIAAVAAESAAVADAAVESIDMPEGLELPPRVREEPEPVVEPVPVVTEHVSVGSVLTPRRTSTRARRNDEPTPAAPVPVAPAAAATATQVAEAPAAPAPPPPPPASPVPSSAGGEAGTVTERNQRYRALRELRRLLVADVRSGPSRR